MTLPDDDLVGYREIAAELRERIQSGALGPGARLPSERTVSQTYGVSTATARRALHELRDEGLIDMRRGTESTVRREPDREVFRVQRGSSWTIRMPTPEERTQLRIPAGVPVLVLRHPGGRVEVIAGDRVLFESH